MSQVLANLCVRNPDPLVKYQPFNPIEIDKQTVSFQGVNNVNFHIQTLIEEVKKTPRKELKEYRKTIRAFLATLSVSFLISPLRSMATGLPTTAQTGTNLPNSAEGLPPELFDILIKLLVIAVASAVILAIILLVVAGVMKMFRKKKEANEWTVDIVKGVIQVITAPTVIFLIYFIAHLLFGSSGWFVSPFAMH
jgi:ABC-type Fe3+ transport system permease subunit